MRVLFITIALMCVLLLSVSADQSSQNTQHDHDSTTTSESNVADADSRKLLPLKEKRACLASCYKSLVNERPHCDNYENFFFTNKAAMHACHRVYVHCADEHCGGEKKFAASSYD
eukprot:TRINITY_DN340_c0_g1_i1.p1 TRINITY_DN340_c0_g1~~TRINITY_DN340_c0_g1_i1.p1  ORF type:complete len:115 (-),score=25.82 TRINITY_DN340_c0_g1_i1:13-357(-)